LNTAEPNKQETSAANKESVTSEDVTEGKWKPISTMHLTVYLEHRNAKPTEVRHSTYDNKTSVDSDNAAKPLQILAKTKSTSG